MMPVFNMVALDAQRRTGGNLVLAGFDAVIGSLRLTNCAVVQRPDRTLIAELPGRAQSVRIIDTAIEREFQEAALAAYRTVTEGGHDAV